MKIIIALLFFLTLHVQAKTCPEGTYLVQGHPRQAHYRSDGTYVSEAVVSSYCRHYRNDGPLKEQFFIRMPKGWPHKSEKFKTCSNKKQKQISKILKSIPKILTDVGKLKIYCAKKSEMPKNPATSAPEVKAIVLYDSSFKMDTKRIIIHELAHLLWSRLSDKEIESYYKASNWIDLENGIYVYNKTSFSEPDGKLNPEEDFSNNIEYYFSEPKYFKKSFPKINQWINRFLEKNK